MSSPSRHTPFVPRLTPRDWPELERIEHPVAWFDADGRLLRDNAAFRRRRGAHGDLLWVLAVEPRRGLIEAIARVASVGGAPCGVEMAAAGGRWELITIHPIADRPGTVLLELQDVTRRRSEERRLDAQSAPVRAIVGRVPPADRPSGLRRAVGRVQWLEAAIASDGPALLLGERGSGKSHGARTIHAVGPRRGRAFVEVRCADLGAAGFARVVLGDGLAPGEGALDRAEGGSLHLDGVDELPPMAQSKLLRLVRDDSDRAIRWMASLVRPPGAPDATIRSDLLEVLREVEVRVPPLRERLEELPSLVRTILTELTRGSASPEALVVLARYPWPGNVRELSGVLARAATVAEARASATGLRPIIEGADVAALLGQREDGAGDDGRSLATRERDHVARVLAESRHSVVKAAAALGISRSTLYAKLRRHGIARSPA